MNKLHNIYVTINSLQQQLDVLEEAIKTDDELLTFCFKKARYRLNSIYERAFSIAVKNNFMTASDNLRNDISSIVDDYRESLTL